MEWFWTLVISVLISIPFMAITWFISSESESKVLNFVCAIITGIANIVLTYLLIGEITDEEEIIKIFCALSGAMSVIFSISGFCAEDGGLIHLWSSMKEKGTYLKYDRDEAGYKVKKEYDVEMPGLIIALGLFIGGFVLAHKLPIVFYFISSIFLLVSLIGLFKKPKD